MKCPNCKQPTQHFDSDRLHLACPLCGEHTAPNGEGPNDITIALIANVERQWKERRKRGEWPSDACIQRLQDVLAYVRAEHDPHF